MKLMEIDSLRIDGVDYDVSILDESTQVSLDTLGTYDKRNRSIKILDSGEKVNIQTLWHEILHAINENRLNSALDEREIESLATGICQVLFDNSDFALACYYADIPDIEFEPDDEPDNEPDEDGDEED